MKTASVLASTPVLVSTQLRKKVLWRTLLLNAAIASNLRSEAKTSSRVLLYRPSAMSPYSTLSSVEYAEPRTYTTLVWFDSGNDSVISPEVPSSNEKDQ